MPVMTTAEAEVVVMFELNAVSTFVIPVVTLPVELTDRGAPVVRLLATSPEKIFDVVTKGVANAACEIRNISSDFTCRSPLALRRMLRQKYN